MGTRTRGSRPPGPASGRWVNLVRYLRDPIGWLTALARTHGDVVYVQLGPNNVYLVSDPALIRDVLVTHHRRFHKSRAYEEAKRVVGEGLLTSEGDFHQRQRRLLQPVFLRERVSAYAGLMVAAAERVAERWQDGDVVDVNGDMSRLTLSIVGRALLDADVETDATEVNEALESSFAVFNRFLMPFPRLLWALPLPKTRRFERNRARLDALIERLIAERRASGPGADLLSLLLEARDDDGVAMSDRQIRDEVVTILLAGHETTALALGWAWYLLAGHPDAEERLQLELESVLGGRSPTLDDLSSLDVTRAVLSEALRLYPPAWAVARRAVAPHELAGWAVPPGSIVFMSQAVVHRDPRYFAEPERFLPERWSGEEEDRRRHAYFPFGAGPRLCIGERFAWMEATLVLATLAQRCRLRRVSEESPGLRPVVTLRPRRSIRLRAEARVSLRATARGLTPGHAPR